MKVPVNPNTRVPQTQLGYVRGGQLPDYNILANVLGDYAEYENKKRADREDFELQTSLLDTTNKRQADYTGRVEAAEPGAPQFVERVAADYQQQDQELTKSFRERGFDEERVNRYALQLASQTVSYTGKAIAFREESEKRQALSSAGAAADNAELYSKNNPDARESAVEQFTTIVRAMPIQEQEQNEILEARLPKIREAAGIGLATTDPRRVLAALSPQDLVKSRQVTTTVGGSGDFNMVSYLQANRSAESSGNDTIKARTSSAYGRYQFLKTTWLENYAAVYGNTDETQAQILAKRADGATQDKVMEHFTRENIARLEAAGVPVRPASVYLAHFLGVDGAIKVLNAPEGTLLTTVVDADSRNSNRRVFEKNKTIEDLVLWARNKMGGDSAVTTTETVTDPAPEKVNDPILSDLPPDVQLRLTSLARQELNRTRVDNSAAVQVAVQNANAEALATGTAPTVDWNMVEEEKGPVVRQQMEAQVATSAKVGQVLQNSKTLPAAALMAQVEALRPAPGDPAFDIKNDLYQKAKSAASAELEAREKDPTGYVFSNFPKVAAKLSEGPNQDGFMALNAAYEQLAIPEADRLPLQKEQLAELGEKYNTLGPPARLAFMRTWREALRGTGMYDNFTQQLAESDSQFSQDGVVDYVLRGTPNYTSTMQVYFKGRAEMLQDPAKRPSPAALNKLMAAQFGPAFASMNTALSVGYGTAAQAIFVANGGRTDADFGGLSPEDKTLFTESLRQAVGGIKGNSQTGWFTNAKGPLTVLPPSTTRQQWDGWLSRMTVGDITQLAEGGKVPRTRDGRGISIQEIRDNGVFVQTAPNRYALWSVSGQGFYASSTGNKAIFVVTPETVKAK